MSDNLTSSSSSSVFDLFPAEVWEIILDEVESSYDIFNTLVAYPELGLKFQKKKHVWLFEMVIPALWEDRQRLQLLGNNDLLNCRKVCKHWKQGVDGYLEGNQPNLRTLNPDDIGARDGSQLCLRKDLLAGRFQSWRGYSFGCRGSFGCLNLRRGRAIPRFLNQWGTSSGTPPFLRTVRLDGNGYSEHDFKKSWNENLKLLRAIGKHVWNLEFRYFEGDPGLDPERFENVLQKLSWEEKRNARMHPWIQEKWEKLFRYLPNLKHLCLDGDALFLESVDQLPNLQHLEALKLDSFEIEPVILHKLLNAYSGQLRRLEFYADSLPVQRKGLLEDSSKWNLDLPKLTELKIDQLKQEHMKCIRKTIGTLWNMPFLLRLTLRESSISRPNFYLWDDLIPWMEQRFPRLQSFNASGTNGMEYLRERRKQSMELVPGLSSISSKYASLTFLKFQDHGRFTYEFLRHLPSLQYLHIDSTSQCATVIDHSNDPYVVTMKESMQSGRLYQSPLWESLPRLKEIILMFGSRRTKQFNRMVFDNMRETGNWNIMQPGDYHPLREDIVECLKRRAEQYERYPALSRSEIRCRSPVSSEDELDNAEKPKPQEDGSSEYSYNYDDDEYYENSISDIESSSDFTSESD